MPTIMQLAEQCARALARVEQEYREALNAMTTTDLVNLTK